MDRKLIDYLPPIMQEYEEIQKICNADQLIKDRLWNDIDLTYKDLHLDTQSPHMASMWEKTLNITPLATDSLETRTSRIKAKIQESLPYTYRTLKRLLDSVLSGTEYRLDIDYDNFILSVKARDEGNALLSEVESLIDGIVPAHIIMQIGHLFNTHLFLSSFPNYFLSNFTYKELHESELNKMFESGVGALEQQSIEDIEQLTVKNLENFIARKE